MATITQRSFAGGELSPSLYARVDVAKYQIALRTLRNFFVMRHGGAANRPGTKFICEVKDSTDSVRLIPFIFNTDQTYVLEFGDQYIRVIKSGVQQREASKTITGITQADPAVVSITSHGYSNGDEVYISGVSGMIEVNKRSFKVAGVTANTFEIQTMDGVDLDSSGYTAYSSGGTAEKVYEISTPYVSSDLSTLQFVQSADVITIVHPSYEPRTLSRTGDTSWILSLLQTEPTIAGPSNIAFSSGPSGSITLKYKVTAIKEDTLEESYAGLGPAKTITGITQSDPAVVSSTSHGFANGDVVYIDGVVGMTEVNGLEFVVNNVGANDFELQDKNGNDIDSSAYTAYSSGGSAYLTFIKKTSGAEGSTSTPNVLTWDHVDGAKEYNVYRELNGVFGLIGIAGSNTFNDVSFDIDTTDTPPIDRNLFLDAGDFPSAITYYQQRLILANTNNEPEKIFGSRTGRFTNFTTTSPLQSDDAVTFTLASRQVNSVRHLIDLGRLVVLTQSGEWAVNGDGSGVLTPFDINARQYSYNGASTLSPIVVGGTAIYVQARGNIVRDLDFDYTVEGYRGTDLTIYSSHLVDGYSLVDWNYAQIPHQIVWAVRNDGVLLGLTYSKEQQMLAWHRHDTYNGAIENVVSVPEGNEDVVYWVVKRTIGSSTYKYIERMGSRFINETAVEDATFMDSFVTYDGRNKSATTMTLSGGTDWTYEEDLTLTASASYFASTDVGDQIHITGVDGSILRCSITAYSSSTVVTVRSNKTVPAAMRSTAFTTWSKALNTVDGLWHLEGEDVSIFGDAFVISNPNNDAYEVVTVFDGKVTLSEYYAVIHVGLPITADIETLNIDTAQAETLADKKMIVNGVTVFVEKTRGLWVGGAPPPDETSDFLGGLTEIKIRETEAMDDPVALRTGLMDVNIESTWNSNGRVFLRQTDPVPAAILAIAPAGLFPIRG